MEESAQSKLESTICIQIRMLDSLLSSGAIKLEHYNAMKISLVEGLNDAKESNSLKSIQRTTYRPGEKLPTSASPSPLPYETDVVPSTSSSSSTSKALLKKRDTAATTACSRSLQSSSSKKPSISRTKKIRTDCTGKCMSGTHAKLAGSRHICDAEDRDIDTSMSISIASDEERGSSLSIFSGSLDSSCHVTSITTIEEIHDDSFDDGDLLPVIPAASLIEDEESRKPSSPTDSQSRVITSADVFTAISNLLENEYDTEDDDEKSHSSDSDSDSTDAKESSCSRFRNSRGGATKNRTMNESKSKSFIRSTHQQARRHAKRQACDKTTDSIFQLQQAPIVEKIILPPLFHNPMDGPPTVIESLPPDFSCLTEERAVKRSFNLKTKTWNEEKCVVKLGRHPFARGSLRVVYYMDMKPVCDAKDSSSMDRKSMDRKESIFPFTNKSLTNTKNTTKTTSSMEQSSTVFVAKQSIDPFSDRSVYYRDVEMQAHCAYYASLFNSYAPPLLVSFLDAFVIEMIDRSGSPLLGVERFIPGDYKKHNNNFGFIEEKRNTPQAFSHFTYEASKHELLVVDLQGVGDIYTDPQVHTVDGCGFGEGNMGKEGFAKFLESHCCNAICRYLRLPPTTKVLSPSVAVDEGGTVPSARVMLKRQIAKEKFKALHYYQNSPAVSMDSCSSQFMATPRQHHRKRAASSNSSKTKYSMRSEANTPWSVTGSSMYGWIEEEDGESFNSSNSNHSHYKNDAAKKMQSSKRLQDALLMESTSQGERRSSLSFEDRDYAAAYYRGSDKHGSSSSSQVTCAAPCVIM